MNTLESKLIEYGLNEKEARVYLSSMELGPSPVLKIASQADINRVTAYSVIETLMEKGLMSSYQEGKKSMYVASDPESLLNFFESQKHELERKKEDLERSLPQFRSKYNTTEGKPIVRYYEGIEGVIAMNQEAMKEQVSNLLTAYNLDITKQYFSPELHSRIKAVRIENNTDLEVLYTTKEGGEMKSNATREVYKVEGEEFEGDIAIYNDKVRFLSFSDKISGIIIEDKQIAKTMAGIFRLAVQSVRVKKQ